MKVPTSEPAQRVAALFSRRLTTAWAEKEIRVFRKLVKAHCFDTLDDLDLIEKYYAFERKKGDKGIHRRDLYTFINNWHGELDRATAWREAHPLKTERKIIPMPPVAPSNEPSPDPEQLAEQVEKYRRIFGKYPAWWHPPEPSHAHGLQS